MLVYHFLDEKYGLQNLTNHRLKISLFDSVNDPFELYCHSLGDAVLRKRMGEFKKTTAAGKGMICFSRSMSSPVQWAHYANRHKGICLGLEIPSRFLQPVNYVSDRVDFRMDQPWAESGVDERVKECFLTKYDHWSYEEEVRLFGDLGTPDKESGLYFRPFDKDIKLVEVYVGCASEITKQSLVTALGDLARDVKCFKVRPAFNTFKMVKNLSEDWNL